MSTLVNLPDVKALAPISILAIALDTDVSQIIKEEYFGNVPIIGCCLSHFY